MATFSAVSQLTKHGWTEGSGLGRNEHGMSEAIKVNLKFDTKGVGHNAADEFTYHWWDHAFNQAASNIDVKVDDNEVKVVKSGEFQISAKKMYAKPSAYKSMLYGRFVKAGTLTGNEMVSENVSDVCDDSDSEVEDKSTAAKVTDEELFKICGGLTAHKGARHGLKLNGKLQRIMEQEKLLSAANTPPASPKHSSENSEHSYIAQKAKKSKKKKKEKKAKKEEMTKLEFDTPNKLKKSKKCKTIKAKNTTAQQLISETPECPVLGSNQVNKESEEISCNTQQCDIDRSNNGKAQLKKRKKHNNSDSVETTKKSKKRTHDVETIGVDNDYYVKSGSSKKKLKKSKKAN